MNDTIRTLERELTDMPESRPGERAERLNALAFALHRFDATRAASTATEAHALATTIGDVRSMARSLSILAECRRVTGNAVESLELIEQVERIALETDDSRMLAQSLHQRGMILHTLGRPAEAVGLLQRAIDIAQTLERHDVLIGAYDVLGIVYQTLGLPADALLYHLQALELLGEGATDAHAAAHTNIAGLYLRLGHDESVLAHSAKALDIYRALGNSIGEAGVLMNIGICHEARERWSESLEFYRQALPLARRHQNHNLLPLLLANMGTVYERLGDYAEALVYETEAKELAQGRSRVTFARVLCCLGRLHLSMGNPEGATEALTEGMEIAGSIGAAGLCAIFHEELARLYETTGNSRKALQQYRLATELRERIAGDEIRDRIQRLRIQYELRRIQAEHALVRERAEALEEAVERKSRELAAMALHLAHKQKALMRMKEELERQPRRGRRGEKKMSKDIRDAIDVEIRSESEWERFRRHFDTIYPDFVGRLAQRYPDLTPTEIRICSLLKLQLSSKDIAALLCVSRHTVDTHRQSLRRKLGLESRAGLVAFLLAF